MVRVYYVKRSRTVLAWFESFEDAKTWMHTHAEGKASDYVSWLALEWTEGEIVFHIPY